MRFSDVVSLARRTRVVVSDASAVLHQNADAIKTAANLVDAGVALVDQGHELLTALRERRLKIEITPRSAAAAPPRRQRTP